MATVTVMVNGDIHRIAPDTTVADLLTALGIEGRGVAVAIRGEIVSRHAWSCWVLNRGDVVEVLSIVQGGCA